MASVSTAFISGAATGIGAALVSKLLDENWQVFAGYNHSPPESASWYGHSRVIPVKCDISKVSEVEAAAGLVAAETGNKLDLLINNAGYFGSGGVLEAPDMDEYRKTMEINLFGAFNMLTAFMPLIRNADKGRVINVTSTSTYMTFPLASAYTVSKQALMTASMHLRMELAPFGIQVTTLVPGPVDTPMSSDRHANAEKQWSSIPDQLREQYRRHFIDSNQMMDKSFSLYTPEKFAAEVYRRIISRSVYKPLYLVGPGVTVLPWLHRLLPRQQVENIWARLFRAR